MEIVHQAEHSRFLVEIDNQRALLEYRLLPEQRVDFTYTFVPPSLRGRGIAEKLVRTGLAWAREQGLEMQASCWYVQRFLR